MTSVERVLEYTNCPRETVVGSAPGKYTNTGGGAGAAIITRVFLSKRRNTAGRLASTRENRFRKRESPLRSGRAASVEPFGRDHRAGGKSNNKR